MKACAQDGGRSEKLKLKGANAETVQAKAEKLKH
jgi:hypothetical protein